MLIGLLGSAEHNPALPLGMPTLSIVASTASSVALLLLLVVLFVLLQPRLNIPIATRVLRKLKSRLEFHPEK